MPTDALLGHGEPLGDRRGRVGCCITDPGIRFYMLYGWSSLAATCRHLRNNGTDDSALCGIPSHSQYMSFVQLRWGYFEQ